MAVAEAIGGNEETFARLMTRKAQSLGMTRTIFRNASGLPNEEQVTTARDLRSSAGPSRTVSRGNYRYFSKPEHSLWARSSCAITIPSGPRRRLDGIKTGYIRASGFNLLTSVKLDGRRVVAVVMGGRTAAHRDDHGQPRREHVEQGARTRTAALITEGPSLESVADTRAQAPAPVAAPAPAPRQAERPVAAAEPPGRPLALNSYAPVESARPAVVSAGPRDEVSTASIRPATPNTISGDRRPVTGSATPSTLRWSTGPRGVGQAAPKEANALTPPAAIPQAGGQAQAQKIALRAEPILRPRPSRPCRAPRRRNRRIRASSRPPGPPPPPCAPA